MVVVRASCSEHVSVDMNALRMHRIRVAEHLGASSRRPRHPRALDDEELFIIEGSPGAQRPDGRSAKNGLKKARKPLIAAITAIRGYRQGRRPTCR